MRALHWYGANDLRVREVPDPRAGPGQALVAVERVGLCGTDLEEYLTGPHDIPIDPHPRSGYSAPLTPGHEVVGTVVECPDDPSWVGRRVIPDVVEGCGDCFWCLRHEEGLCPQLVVLGMHAPGGLAELMLCRSSTLVAVPAALRPEVAAFAEPLAVAVRAVAKAGDLRGCTILVVGGGVVGNLVAQVATAAGAVVLVQDPSHHRRALAEQVGAGDVVVDAVEGRRWLLEHTSGRMADIVFECAGAEQAFGDAVSACRSGGLTVLVGLGVVDPALPWRDIVLSEKRLVGTAAHIWDLDVVTAVRMLAGGLVAPRPLLSRVVDLGGVAGVLDELAAPNQLAKVLVDPRCPEGEQCRPD